MRSPNRPLAFWRCEDGAISLDWIALASSLLVMGVVLAGQSWVLG